MATVKISDLASINSLNSADVFPTVDSGANPGSPTTYKVTVRSLANSLTQVSSSISASHASTASIATNVTGSIFTSTNQALSASHARTAATASFITLAQTASFVTTAQTASYVTGSVHGATNPALSASYALSASFSLTASYALNGGGAGSPGGSPNQLQYNNAGAFGGVSTAVFDGTTLRVTGSFSGSLVGALIGTSSWALNSVTASFITTAQTASFVNLARSASYINDLSQNVTITGSLIVSGSPSPEIRIFGEMTITGSLSITGSNALRVFSSVNINSGSLAVGNIAASATVGRIDASNDVVAFSTSDQRLKTEITPIENALSKVMATSGVHFTWIENLEVHGNSGRDVGVIAQEIERVLPEVVTTRDSGYKAVKYEKIIPLLIEAIKELQKQIDELKANR